MSKQLLSEGVYKKPLERDDFDFGIFFAKKIPKSKSSLSVPLSNEFFQDFCPFSVAASDLEKTIYYFK
jgi:hypothetical protein